MFREFLLWSQNRTIKVEKVFTGFVEPPKATGFIEQNFCIDDLLPNESSEQEVKPAIWKQSPVQPPLRSSDLGKKRINPPSMMTDLMHEIKQQEFKENAVMVDYSSDSASENCTQLINNDSIA